MTPPAPLLGVATPNPAQPAPTPVPPALPPAQPAAAQAALGLLLLLAVALLAWNVAVRNFRSTRPTALEPEASALRIDLNRADHAQLLQLPGAGENLVGRIEAYRREHGGFRSVDDLRHVSGVGPVLLERWRPLVDVSLSEDDPDPDPNPPTPGTLQPVIRAAMPDDPPGAARAGGAGSNAGGKRPLAAGEMIDVNRASAADLQRLPGVGPALAARIVEARARKPFASVEDLRHVSGIGAKTLDKLRPHVRVD